MADTGGGNAWRWVFPFLVGLGVGVVWAINSFSVTGAIWDVVRFVLLAALGYILAWVSVFFIWLFWLPILIAVVAIALAVGWIQRRRGGGEGA